MDLASTIWKYLAFEATELDEKTRNNEASVKFSLSTGAKGDSP